MRTPTLVLGLLALFVACSNDNPVDNNIPPPDPTKANQLATAGFQSLGDTLQTLGNLSNDQLRDFRFDSIRDKLEKALTYESNNGIAHLGLAIVEILELNYSSDIWEVVDSLDAWGGGNVVPKHFPPLATVDRNHVLIGRQFQLMAALPMAASMRMATTFPSNVSVARIQNIITNTIRPALNRSVGHLNVVEGQTDTNLRIKVDKNGTDEFIVIDLGEIDVFSASVRALRSGFEAATAYDMDLLGTDDTYNWLDDVRDHNGSDYCNQYAWKYQETGYPDSLVDIAFRRDVGYDQSLVDSILVQVLHYNLETRSAFLSLRDDGSALADAHTDLVAALTRLESAVTFIRHRSHESEENVIKLTDLTDLDSRLGDPDGPNFAKNWTKIEDVIGFARNLLSGPVTFTENLGPNDTPYTWTMNFAALYNNPVADWNSLLPYHRWDLPAGDWLASSLDSLDVVQFGGGPFQELVDVGDGTCSLKFWPKVGQITWQTTRWDIDTSGFLNLLDAPNGNVIDTNVARFPYFPDYTFSGLFPAMTRAKWLQLIDVLDPPGVTNLAQVRGAHR